MIFLLGCFAGAIVAYGMVAIFGAAKEADAWMDGYAAGQRRAYHPAPPPTRPAGPPPPPPSRPPRHGASKR